MCDVRCLKVPANRDVGSFRVTRDTDLFVFVGNPLQKHDDASRKDRLDDHITHTNHTKALKARIRYKRDKKASKFKGRTIFFSLFDLLCKSKAFSFLQCAIIYA